jgi:poly-beta-1,6-N-acetyl-D-glucosamine synthase
MALGDYALISPVRNEAKNIEATLQSVTRQTRLPLVWVIVDDGSTDRTPELAERYAASRPWIRLLRLPDRGYYDLMEAGELRAFLTGLATIESMDYEFLGKLDGDISFGNEYYDGLLRHFEESPRLGIASGTCWYEESGRLVMEAGYSGHVRGAMRIYRRACWDDIGGVVRSLGWDAIDCYKARMRGWQTRSYEGLPVRHHVKTWTKGGLLHGRRRSGRIDYLIGTHPLFFAAKVLREIPAKPLVAAAAALAWGYAAAWFKREPRVADHDLVKFVRSEQSSRLIRFFSMARH